MKSLAVTEGPLWQALRQAWQTVFLPDRCCCDDCCGLLYELGCSCLRMVRTQRKRVGKDGCMPVPQRARLRRPHQQLC